MVMPVARPTRYFERVVARFDQFSPRETSAAVGEFVPDWGGNRALGPVDIQALQNPRIGIAKRQAFTCVESFCHAPTPRSRPRRPHPQEHAWQ